MKVAEDGKIRRHYTRILNPFFFKYFFFDFNKAFVDDVTTSRKILQNTQI